MASTASLADKLSALLPIGVTLSLHHIAHKPIKTEPLYTPSAGQPAQPTTCETHLLAVSHSNILVFAIEVLIYISTIKNPSTGKSYKETTIFVSKADSSGYLPAEAASFHERGSPVRESTLRTIASAFLAHIVQQHREAHPNIRKTTISLFARAQSQYLFPDSASNPKKHVLDDRGLIRWWCRVLDPILQSYNSEEHEGDKAAAYLLVPGLDKYETTVLFPSKTRQAALYPDAKRWVHGHPLKIDPSRGITVREVIPHFPDDPKARFLDELDAEYVSGNKKAAKVKGSGWANVTTLEQFWELMSFRQECSAGHSVGFIWLVIEKEKMKKPGRQEDIAQAEEAVNEETSKEELSSTTEVPLSTDTPGEGTTQASSFQDSTTNSSPSTEKSSPSSILYPVILTSANYKKIHEALLCSDFCNLEMATLNSRKWLDGVLTLLGPAGLSKLKESGRDIRPGNGWGEVVVGKKGVDTVSNGAPDGNPAPALVNVLSVRKKLKRENAENDSTSTNNAVLAAAPNKALNGEGDGVKLLSESFIRKKQKLDTAQPTQPTIEQTNDGVNVLSAGFLKKKPKPSPPSEDTAAPTADTMENA